MLFVCMVVQLLQRKPADCSGAVAQRNCRTHKAEWRKIGATIAVTLASAGACKRVVVTLMRAAPCCDDALTKWVMRTANDFLHAEQVATSAVRVCTVHLEQIMAKSSNLPHTEQGSPFMRIKLSFIGSLVGIALTGGSFEAGFAQSRNDADARASFME